MFCNAVSYGNIIYEMYCSEVLNKVFLKNKNKITKKERVMKAKRASGRNYSRTHRLVCLVLLKQGASL